MAIKSKSALFRDTTVYKPFEFPWAVEKTVEHERMHWHEAEVPLGDDVSDWKGARMTDNQRNFITQVLRLFTQADVAVGAYYYDNLIPVFRNNEVRNLLGSFANREGTHQRAYALLNDTLGLPEGEYSAFLKYKEMADKNDHMVAADTSTLPGLAMALAKGTFNEGVSLFASFAMLLDFQRRGLMKGMGKIVEWSIKDESAHVIGVSMLFKTVCEAHPEIVTDAFKHAIYDLARKTVELEDAFVDLAYAANPEMGVSAIEIKAYVRFIMDRRLTQLGLKPNFMVADNPLPWLDWIVGGTDHTNFFENKSAEYEKGGLQGEWAYDEALPRPLTIYTMAGCSWCVRAKTLMESVGISYADIDLSEKPERDHFFESRGFNAGDRTMPKIYTADAPYKLIGGYTQLSEYIAAGKHK